MKKDDELLLYGNHDHPEFIITYLTEEEHKKYNFEFAVQKIVGWYEGVDKQFDLEPWFRGTIKWDGCSHFWFGDKDGYMHLCGSQYFQEIRGLLKKLYELASEAMGKEVDEPWGEDIQYSIEAKT